MITPEELSAWIIHEDEETLAVNKPGLVVCHPSKHGPWSSLIGAAREYTGLARLHMPSRLDRETSGVVVLAKSAELGSRMQQAIQHRRVQKSYLAVLQGSLEQTVTVEQPIGPHPDSGVAIRRAVRADGQPALTAFEPVRALRDHTLVRVRPHTGRLHQIRVHAQWLGRPVAGDKIYGGDETLFLEFIERGFTGRVREALPLPRQALHAERLALDLAGETRVYEAPLTADLAGWIELLSI
jgi:23S rRNA pseudouridine1911/1915/1917 synthase